MSLRVQLPLNGNLNNQGASGCNPVQSTAPTYVNGKIGKAMSTGAFYLPAAEIAKFYNNNAMSWCFWIYVNGTGSAGIPIIGQSNTSAGDCRMFTIYQYPNTVDLHLSWQNETGGNAFCSAILSNAFTANTWNHCAITYNGSTILIYINGTLKQTYTNIVSSRSNFSYNVPIPNASIRYLNDIRIYDHVLSAKEVKEISKGLVAHYPLDGSGKCNDNILPGTFVNEVTYTYPSSSFSDKWAATTSIIPSASQYVLSFWAKSTVNRDKVRAHYYNPNTTTRCESSQGVVTTASDGNIDITLSTEWKKYWIVYTQSSTTAVKHVIFPRMFNGSGSGTVSVKQVKFEEGTIPTPWCPNSSDSTYTTLGYNSTTEIDTSGYKNHGTRTKVMNTVSNTARYGSGTVFDGDNDCILVPFNSIIKDTTYTISVQCYKSVIGTDYYQTIFGGPSGFELEARNGQTNEAKFVTQNWGKVAYAYNFNEWYHVCFVHTSSDSKLYVNGNLIGTGTSASIPSGNYYIGSWRDTTSQNYQGNMSDFRIYATALSADDVKELYSSSASIANNGTVMCYEFNEE